MGTHTHTHTQVIGLEISAGRRRAALIDTGADVKRSAQTETFKPAAVRRAGCEGWGVDNMDDEHAHVCVCGMPVISKGQKRTYSGVWKAIFIFIQNPALYA